VVSVHQSVALGRLLSRPRVSCDAQEARGAASCLETLPNVHDFTIMKEDLSQHAHCVSANRQEEHQKRDESTNKGAYRNESQTMGTKEKEEQPMLLKGLLGVATKDTCVYCECVSANETQHQDNTPPPRQHTAYSEQTQTKLQPVHYWFNRNNQHPARTQTTN
jgi:hypothetical protein